MRPDPLSTHERHFIIDGLIDNYRLDGRTRDEFRQVKLVVGSECGTALCTMGSTKETVLVDPTDKEQQCLSGCLVVACNKRREVCALHQSTNLILKTSTIETCVRRAMQRAVDLSELVSTVIHDDAHKRAKYEKPVGFEITINADLLTCREAHPNELVAPFIELATGKDKAQQPSVVINVCTFIFILCPSFSFCFIRFM
uniref:RNase_PH_C domain-containing protein n=1 Tax=Heterorhabditis bacteriophora TaxID=37862 RepID=A0A1I7XRU0_HETBA